MSLCLGFFRFVARAAVQSAGFGPAGELVAEVVPDIAMRVQRWWIGDRDPAVVNAEAAAVAALPDLEVRQLVEQAIDLELMEPPPPAVRAALTAYLTHLPATLRRAGPLTAADGLALPTRLPRFTKGTAVPGFPDWALTDLLGVGGFGEVWKATHPLLPPAAMKFCLDPRAARSLRTEAHLLGRVMRHGRHPGFVALLDTSLTADPPCLKYEFVEGGTLADFIRRGPLAPPAATAVLRELADAAAFAHTIGVVHRDLKPANVLDDGGRWRITDLGIGGLTRVTDQTALTAPRGACTPLYASPQQRRGEGPSPADDVFSLGVIGFQLLTGRLSDRPEADWRDDLKGTGPLLDVLARCLAAKPERRYADAAELRDNLAGLTVSDEADDDADPATRLQRTLTRAAVDLAQARDRAERHHDYAGAVALMERLPAALRDSDWLDELTARRDRVAVLRQRIEANSSNLQFGGLSDDLDEYLSLVPNDEAMRALLAFVPYRPGPEVINALGMQLVLVQPGTFGMGAGEGEMGRHPSEGPRHEETVARPFYLGAYPVTQEQYRRVMGVNPSHFHLVMGHDAREFPVECVSYEDAITFCIRLSALPEERSRGRAYRLPTEAEWEYACRAGTDTAFGTGWGLGSCQANFDGRHPYGCSAKGGFLKRTTAVGSYEPNGWGLYDMHGNVWEWTSDSFDGGYGRPRSRPEKVRRGGSWQNHGRLCRSAARDWAMPTSRSLNVGFRVVLDVRPEWQPSQKAPRKRKST